MKQRAVISISDFTDSVPLDKDESRVYFIASRIRVVLCMKGKSNGTTRETGKWSGTDFKNHDTLTFNLLRKVETVNLKGLKSNPELCHWSLYSVSNHMQFPMSNAGVHQPVSISLLVKPPHRVYRFGLRLNKISVNTARIATILENVLRHQFKLTRQIKFSVFFYDSLLLFF